jgi:hypothetical protein
MSRPRFSCTISILLALLACGCIKRTASIASGPGKTASGSTAALGAKNARIANLPRTDLVGAAGNAAFKLQGSDVAKVELTTIPIAGMPFSDALRADVKEETGHEWAVQLQSPIAATVEDGDAILATFFLRTEVPQPGSVGETQFVFELAQSPYTKSVAYPVQGSADWSKVQVRFASAGKYAAGEAQMIFRLGYDRQIIQLGGIKVENFGKKLQVGALPATRPCRRTTRKAATCSSRSCPARSSVPSARTSTASTRSPRTTPALPCGAPAAIARPPTTGKSTPATPAATTSIRATCGRAPRSATRTASYRARSISTSRAAIAPRALNRS